MGRADEAGITARFVALEPVLDEQLRRLVAAAEAQAAGPRGISVVARATGVSRRAIRTGKSELEQLRHSSEASSSKSVRRIRKPGGGRKKNVDKDPTLLTDLEKLVEPVTRGDPESPLRWTCKSVRVLASELQSKGHVVSHQLVSELLMQLGYSLQA